MTHQNDRPNAAVLVAVMFRQQSELLMRLIFVLGNGPLLLAIVIWRNNFVFHDLEQVTSVMLHVSLHQPSRLQIDLNTHRERETRARTHTLSLVFLFMYVYIYI